MITTQLPRMADPDSGCVGWIKKIKTNKFHFLLLDNDDRDIISPSNSLVSFVSVGQ